MSGRPEQRDSLTDVDKLIHLACEFYSTEGLWVKTTTTA